MPKVHTGTGTPTTVSDVAPPDATPAAPAEGSASPAEVDGVGGSTVAGGLAHAASTDKPGSTIKALAAKEPPGVKTVEMMSKPRLTSASVSYRMGGQEGRKLKPGEQMLLEIPPQFRDRPIRFAVLKHRQESSETTEPTDGSKWDNKPGVTSVQVHSAKHPEGQAWRFWKAPWGSSGKDGGKYAEHRDEYDPEVENMFDWMKNGHAPVGGYGTSYDPCFADAIRVKSVGKDPVRVHQVDFMFLPDKPDTLDEVIFSPGTKFGDPWTGAGRAYGGGPSKAGKYPGALTLEEWGDDGGEGVGKLKKGWKFEDGELSVQLKPGKKLTGVEIACGDTHPDGVKNKDGHTGTLGWSRLSMGVRRKSGKTEWFIDEQGVPPQGVLFGGPVAANYVAKKGDELVVRATDDTTYVMGLRLWYNE